ncbi:MAG: metalloregulator ArsR/SmtB family transcription factor [Candidatus Enteromonas sp.]|nr:metalloregulator ArsR/SmtB family transcription factor [Candidatus Enteromonas sp.]
MAIPDNDVLDAMQSLLSIVADSTRLKILCSIAKEEKCVSEICIEIGASQSLVSHQIRVMKDANLLASRKEGTRVFYTLADDHVLSLLEVVSSHVQEEKKGN